MVIFKTTGELRNYVSEHDNYERHGDVSIGTLVFIDSPSLHVVFDSDEEYRKWDSCGRPVQLSLF